MRVLITGATGLVGSTLATYFKSVGIDVHYLSTSKKGSKSLKDCHGFLWNPDQGTIDENCMVGVDVIIHLAGASIAQRWTQKYKQEIIESRVMSAHLLYKLLKNNPHQVTQFVSASAIGIYPSSKSAYYTEDETETDPSFLGQVVEKWEDCTDRFRQLNIKVCKCLFVCHIMRGKMMPPNGIKYCVKALM
jgi:NAD dependent epimerase/dehydratase family enzyme